MSPNNQNPTSVSEPTQEKKTFAALFMILAVVLMVLPFFTTFNDLLTRLVMRVEAYRFLQEMIVPAEIKTIGVVTELFGLPTSALPQYLVLGKGEESFLVEIAWNCIGWQSLIILVISLVTGLQGDFKNWTKVLVTLFGIGGTFLMNILRITLVVFVAYFFGQFPAIIFHDYGSILMTIAWLFFFWWFSFAYLLEKKT